MHTPQEIEVKYVLPVLRRQLAGCLIASGLSQKEAAKKIGITGAAISQYFKKKRGNHQSLNIPAAEITKSANRILTGKGTESIEEINRLCLVLRKKGALCCIHRKYGKAMPKCEVCTR